MVVASAGRWLLVTLLLGMAPAFAQQIGVYGGGSSEQSSSRQLTAYVPLVDPASRWTVNAARAASKRSRCSRAWQLTAISRLSCGAVAWPQPTADGVSASPIGLVTHAFMHMFLASNSSEE